MTFRRMREDDIIARLLATECLPATIKACLKNVCISPLIEPLER